MPSYEFGITLSYYHSGMYSLIIVVCTASTVP